MISPIQRVASLALISCLTACGGSGSSSDDASLAAQPAEPVPEKLFQDFQGASVVLGQPDLNTDSGISAASPIDIYGPWGPVEVTNGKLYIPVYDQDRVLIFDTIPTEHYAAANDVLGQFNLDTDIAETSATGMIGPVGVFSDGTRLLVTEYGNNRVLIYNTIPETGSPGTADVVVGQPDMVTRDGGKISNCSASGLDSPYRAIITSDGKLVVSDLLHHRILIWNTVPTSNGAEADVVVGQPDMTSCDRGTTPTASNLNGPTGMWTSGEQLFVADSGNYRILVWDALPTTNGQAADWVMGQPDFSNGASRDTSAGSFAFSEPAIHSDGERLCITDDENHRVLIWNEMPTPDDQLPDVVLGQSDFEGNAHNDDNQDGIDDGTPSARTMYYPSGCTFVGDQLIVSDYSNSRVLIFDAQEME